jgi:iron only hydrogenase large subunit-like protein
MFSLTDDFLSPGEVCVKPIQIKKKTKRGMIGDDDDNVPEKATITLTDCLACSGCVTSAESVLIASQSSKEFVTRVASTTTTGGKVVVSIAPEARASLAAHFGLSLVSTHRKLVTLFRLLGAHNVLDMQVATRVAALESRIEFEERWNTGRPVLASSCPGWICFAEKSHPEALPFISSVRSSQQIMGQFVKKCLAKKDNLAPSQVYHVCVMMCYDKKLEATRDDFCEDGVRHVDTVLATSELLSLIVDREIDFAHLEETTDSLETSDLHGNPEGSGSQAADLYRHIAWSRFGQRVERVPFKEGRNSDVREAVLEVEGKVVLKVAVANGFRNIQNIVRKLKSSDVNFVEIMACPSGCLNGGGQIRAANTADREATKQKLIQTVAAFGSVSVDDEDFATALLPFYKEFVGDVPGSEKAKLLFHTQYHAVPPMESR